MRLFLPGIAIGFLINPFALSHADQLVIGANGDNEIIVDELSDTSTLLAAAEALSGECPSAIFERDAGQGTPATIAAAIALLAEPETAPAIALCLSSDCGAENPQQGVAEIASAIAFAVPDLADGIIDSVEGACGVGRDVLATAVYEATGSAAGGTGAGGTRSFRSLTLNNPPVPERLASPN